MLVLLFSFVIILCWLTFLIKERKWILMYRQFRGDPWSIPIIGNAYIFFSDSDVVRMDALKRFARFAIKQGGLTSLWLGPRYFVVVVDANVVEIVLKKVLAKDDIMNITHELFGNGSIFAPLNIWRIRRKVIAPTFSLKNLNQFVDVFSQQSCILVEKMKDIAGKGTVSIWKYLTTYTMDSVCETALGVKVDAQHHPEHPFLEAFDQHCQMASARIVQPPIAQRVHTFLPKWKTYMKHIHTMWEFVDEVIMNKRKEIVEKKEKGLLNNNNKDPTQKQKTFLELFIESSGGRSGFTDMELREETLVLLLAGTDTSAVGAAFTCLLLARHQDVQEKVYEELKEALGDSDGPITQTDLPKLKYLEAVLKESMRLYPPVPVIVRKADADLQLPSGLSIVKGTSFLINIWGIHRNPVYWGNDAEEFRPDRFLGSTPIHPAAFIPFSYGPRSCLGYQYAMMSMKTALAKIVRNYRLHPASPVRDKNEPLRIKFDIMMKHVDNFELQVEPRT